jgi:hypothetical protein
MWVRTKVDEMINIEKYCVIRVESTSVVARKLDDHLVLFHGNEAACRRALNMILDGLVMALPLVDVTQANS